RDKLVTGVQTCALPICIKAYKERGIDYRWDYTFDDFSPAFRATSMARFFADMFAERNPQADLQTIIHQFEAHAQPDAEDHQARRSEERRVGRGCGARGA